MTNKNKHAMLSNTTGQCDETKAQKKTLDASPSSTSGTISPACTTPEPRVKVHQYYRRPKPEQRVQPHLAMRTRVAEWSGPNTGPYWKLLNYMDNQPNLDYTVRKFIVDWLLRLTARLRMSQNTFSLAVTLLDRTLASVLHDGSSTIKMKRENAPCCGW